MLIYLRNIFWQNNKNVLFSFIISIFVIEHILILII